MPSYKCNCCSKYLNLNGSLVTLGDSLAVLPDFGLNDDGYVSTSFAPEFKFTLEEDYRFHAQSFVLLHDASGNVYYFGPASADASGITWTTDAVCNCGCDCGPSCTTCICGCGCLCPGGSLPPPATPAPEVAAEPEPEPEVATEPEPEVAAEPEPEVAAEPEPEVDDVPVARSAALIEEALNAQAASTGAPTPAAPADDADQE